MLPERRLLGIPVNKVRSPRREPIVLPADVASAIPLKRDENPPPPKDDKP